MLRRVDGVAGSLAREISDEQVDVRGLLLVLVLIEAQKEVPGPEDSEYVLVDGNVGADPAF